MYKLLIPVAAASLLATAAFSDSSAPALGSVKSGTYRVEGTHTQVGFSVSHFGFTNYSGIFSGATGTLALDPAHPADSKLDVIIPVSSILTTVPQLTDELKGDKWFDVSKYPEARFSSTKVSFQSNGELTISGDFTMHGITKPLTFRAHLVGSGVNPIDKAYTIGFEGTGTIKRTDYGVSLYAPALGDQVTLSIAGAFELQT